MEKFFESFLWQSRLVLLIAVICCVITAVALVGLGVYEVMHFVGNLIGYLFNSTSEVSRGMLILSVIEILDTFLISSIILLLVFHLSKIAIIRRSCPAFFLVSACCFAFASASCLAFASASCFAFASASCLAFA